MTDNMMPELTLEPTAAAEAVPQLTLEPTAPEVPEPEEKKIEPVEMDEKLLTDEEKKAVEEFSHKIDVRDTNMILQYGAAAQKSVAGFSESALNNVRSKDLGEIGQDLSRLVVELKGFGDGEEKKGLMGLFKKAGNRLESMKAQYGKVEANVEKIAQSLEQHQITLLKDVAMFDQMYELNLKYYKELTMYILAGKKRLEEVRSGELEELRKKAEQSGTAEDAQAYNDLVNLCNRFEKKIHDLELTRMVSVQMGPQTRLLQNNDTLMIEKIQSSLVNTIPLWKSQMVLALGLASGSVAAYVGRLYRAEISWPVLLGAALGFYALLHLVFRQAARHGGGEIMDATISIGGQSRAVRVLHDTGNTLRSPVTGQPVLVLEQTSLGGLLPPEVERIVTRRAPPEERMAQLHATDLGRRFSLLPFCSIGAPEGLLLAVCSDSVQIGGTTYPRTLVALSPGPVSDGGGYQALWGGTEGRKHEKAVQAAAGVAAQSAQAG